MKHLLFGTGLLFITIFSSCHTSKNITPPPSSTFEGGFSLIIDEVIEYGKEHMSYAFRGCTKIKSSLHLSVADLCQVRIWKKALQSTHKDHVLLPDSTFLLKFANSRQNLDIDESLVNHCVEIYSGIDSNQTIMRNLPDHTLIFSPLIPTNQENFFYLCVVIAKKRDPAEMIFTLIKEGTIYTVVSGFWDDNPCII